VAHPLVEPAEGASRGIGERSVPVRAAGTWRTEGLEEQLVQHDAVVFERKVTRVTRQVERRRRLARAIPAEAVLPAAA
jgi:hypothetical protein